MSRERIDASCQNSRLASVNEYRSLIGDFYKNYRNGWIGHMVKRGVGVEDAEDIFSSVTEYLLKSETYSKYLTSNIQYKPEASGLSKITGFATFIFKVFRTKISNHFRSCKRQLEAMTRYAHTLCEEAFDPEKLLIAAEEKSSAPNSNNVILFTKPNNDKQSYFVAA